MTKPNPLLGFLYLVLAIIWATLLAADLIFGNHWILVLLHFILVALNLGLVEVWLQPLRRFITYTRDQIYFRHLARLRHATYIQFRESVKAGTLDPDEFEPEAKRVIK
jgi:cytochrome bd-type quinol oxidase subunit 1